MLSQSSTVLRHTTANPWSLWTIFFSILLVYISLWLIVNPVWHVTIGILTVLTLQSLSPNPFRTLLFVLGLVLFLAVLQIGFSPFMREMFLRALNEGFFWKDWQYLLFAIERFAWPLVMVSAFQSKLNSPVILTQLTTLFTPFKWLGFKIDKLQLLILLALRFMPSLKREWQRFAHFQTYFMTGLPRKSMLQKLHYGQGVLKAMISHTIYSAVRTGDLLALRGLPTEQSYSLKQNTFLPITFWISMGVLSYFLDLRLLAIWSSFTVWLIMVPLTIRKEVVR